MVKYKLSFTAASALITENVIIAQQYIKCLDWSLTRETVLGDNLLMKDKQATAKRQYMELELRLKTLSDEQLDVVACGGLDDVKSMVWLSIINTYQFIADFVIEVIRDLYFYRGKVVSNSDYYSFWESKTVTNPELTEVSDATVNKVKQVTFKILEQIGIIDSAKSRAIIKPLLSSESEALVIKYHPQMLYAFLCDESFVKQYIQKM